MAGKRRVWRVYLVEPSGAMRDFGKDFARKCHALAAAKAFRRHWPDRKYVARPARVG